MRRLRRIGETAVRIARRNMYRKMLKLETVEAVIDWVRKCGPVEKARTDDLPGRFREIVSDPMNLLIDRHPMAGCKMNGFVVLHNGNIVPVDGPYAYYEGFSDILVINRGVHEPLEEYIFQENIESMPESPVMIELGAYWAHYSMWMKRKRPKARVYLVEPDAHNLSVGQHNVRVNGYEAEFIHAFAGRGQFEVDRFVSERNISHVDMLHIDVQGYETDVLVGSAECLRAKSIDYLFISTHTQDLHRAVCSVLEGHQYRIEASADVDLETTSCDGLVFASSPAVKPVLNGIVPLGRLAITRATSAELTEFISKARAPL